MDTELARPATERSRSDADSADRPALLAILPGLTICAGVSVMAWLAERLQGLLFGHAWIESLIVAIIIGPFVRVWAGRKDGWDPGLRFCSATLLEIAVVLFGLSISGATLHTLGLASFFAIAGLVMVIVPVSYGLGRAAGLRHDCALLVAFGNGICGNSAIAAVASVIDARPADVTAAIGYTAILGVATVLILPLLQLPLGLSPEQFGCFAGALVYAVPQVFAATAPAGPVAVQFGTLTKLTRVMMLGPAIMAAALLRKAQLRRREAGAVLPAGKLLPWFVIGFLVAMMARVSGLVPDPLVRPAMDLANVLTCMSMAALGLNVDLRQIARGGGRLTFVVLMSVAALALLSYCLARFIAP